VPVYQDPADGLTIRADLLREWTAGLIEAIGTPSDIAADVAEVLVASDRRGIASHGTARLPNYVALVEAGVLDPAGRPVRDAGRPALARFDAANGWGHHAGLVRAAGCVRRVHRDRALEHVAACCADPVSGTNDRYEPDRHRRTGRPSWDVLP
jgi:LDH2 family malate/lactate/ureidoglycolate dehydrogenase